MIQGNPNIKADDKPKDKSGIFKLSTDRKHKKGNIMNVTPDDIKIFEKMQFLK